MHQYTVEMWPIIWKVICGMNFCVWSNLLMDMVKPVSSAFCDATEMYSALYVF